MGNSITKRKLDKESINQSIGCRASPTLFVVTLTGIVCSTNFIVLLKLYQTVTLSVTLVTEYFRLLEVAPKTLSFLCRLYA